MNYRVSDLPNVTSLPEIRASMMQSSATRLKRYLEKSHAVLDMDDHTDVLIPSPPPKPKRFLAS